MECLVHYRHLSKYSSLRSLTDETIAALTKAKSIRERVKGVNHHEEQSQGLPETLDKDKHKVHPECYKKFTLINSNQKHANITSEAHVSDSTDATRCSLRLSQEFHQRGNSILRK